jgi:parvulin-like peptidyl-prolyl isomerase
VGYFAKSEDGGRMAKEFSDAAFALSRNGDISDVVRSKFGYHIIRLTGKRGAVTKSYDKVKPRIISKLKTMKRKSAFQSIIEDTKKKLAFKVYKEAIAEIDFGKPEDNQKRRDSLSQK